MLCAEFEDRLTDYLDGALAAETNRDFAAHAMRCPVCHDLLSEVKTTLLACRTSDVPIPPSIGLEARILTQIAPESNMTCEQFEEHLTDYLDGFLPAPLYHRWERHAALCERCTELPGQVVRSIGACYTYISEEMPVPAGLHERILQATLGTVDAEEVRAPLGARIATLIRQWLDPIVSPQLATVATMVLVAVLVLTSTVSSDGSISGVYRASMDLAERTYAQGAGSAIKGSGLPGEIRQIRDSVTGFINNQPKGTTDAKATTEQDKAQQPQQSPEQKK
ncbi:MAG: zf-HC2 domain-containing protein [Pyrinomonadaceae bacterium]